MDKEFEKLIKSLVALQKEAAKQTILCYTSIVEDIIKTNCRDINKIEHTLDALCETAYDDNVLLLFKKLCRYYYPIDPKATVWHIQFYREMWDNDYNPEETEAL